uniref:Putative ovule protein n=1 Tax=Solanum chacoense TaxID=4108 RepID=A0A0V0IZ50_SOLCH
MQQRRTLHTLLSSPPLSSGWRDHAALTATTGEAPPRLLPLLSLSLPRKNPITSHLLLLFSLHPPFFSFLPMETPTNHQSTLIRR